MLLCNIYTVAYGELTSCSIEATKPCSTFSSSIDDVTEKAGLGAEGLAGRECDDTNFCIDAGTTVETTGIAEVADIVFGMDDGVCTLETILLAGGGIVVTVVVVEDTVLPIAFWEATEIGVELNRGCLNGAGGVLAGAAAAAAAVVTATSFDEDDNGTLCTP